MFIGGLNWETTDRKEYIPLMMYYPWLIIYIRIIA
jgi:hypothetical protein